jgi:hypothetical protein
VTRNILPPVTATARPAELVGTGVLMSFTSPLYGRLGAWRPPAQVNPSRQFNAAAIPTAAGRTPPGCLKPTPEELGTHTGFPAAAAERQFGAGQSTHPQVTVRVQNGGYSRARADQRQSRNVPGFLAAAAGDRRRRAGAGDRHRLRLPGCTAGPARCPGSQHPDLAPPGRAGAAQPCGPGHHQRAGRRGGWDRGIPRPVLPMARSWPRRYSPGCRPRWLPSCAPVGAWSSPSGREATRRFSYSGRQAESLEPLTVLTIASFVSLYGKHGFALRKRDH